MIEQIAKTDFYETSVDKAKNRFYTAMQGKWDRMSQVPNLLADSEKALRALTPGFTMLWDATQSTGVSPELQSLGPAIAKRATNLGCRKFANVATQEQIAEMAKQRSASQGWELANKAFLSRAEAEAWLDEK